MDCIFNNFLEEETQITLENDSFYHLLALRIKVDKEILITNGHGLMAYCKVISINKKNASLEIIRIIEDEKDRKYKISLALGLLDNRDRFEFALEKIIELGIDEFFPLKTKFSSIKKYEKLRLESKAIAAICQSKKSELPIINETIDFDKFIENQTKKFDIIYLADIDGEKYTDKLSEENACIIIGPEGGFSQDEIIKLKSLSNLKLINLGKSRLRAETAAISTVVLLNLA